MNKVKKLDWDKLLYSENTKKDSPFVQENDTRTEFKKDFDRICFSSSFRRLQDKAQVFPLEGGDFVRTRLTHSLEVMSIAESLGEGVCETIVKKENKDFNGKIKFIPIILRSAALIHDLGNPPFGHLSEGIIRKWFEDNLERLYYSNITKMIFSDDSANQRHTDNLKSILGERANDFIKYDGNAQTLRIVNRLQTTSSNNGSMKLSYPLLATIIKYPHNPKTNEIWGKKNKQGVFYSESDLYEDIQKKLHLQYCRHPLVYLLEAADDIGYLTVDLEDATKKGLIDVKDFILELNNFIKSTQERIGRKKINALKALKDLQNEILSILVDNKVKLEEDKIENEINKILKLSSTDKFKYHEDNLLAMHKIIIHIKGVLISQVKDIFEENYERIMSGKLNESLLGKGKSKFIEEFLRKTLANKVYFCDSIINNKILGQKVITKLLDILIPSVLNAPTDNPADNSEYLCSRLISDNFYNVCAKELGLKYRGKNENQVKKIVSIQDIVYYKILMVLDHISGMTDSYAKQIYELLQ